MGSHNHTTREVEPYGKCHACDEIYYHELLSENIKLKQANKVLMGALDDMKLECHYCTRSDIAEEAIKKTKEITEENKDE